MRLKTISQYDDEIRMYDTMLDIYTANKSFNHGRKSYIKRKITCD